MKNKQKYQEINAIILKVSVDKCLWVLHEMKWLVWKGYYFFKSCLWILSCNHENNSEVMFSSVFMDLLLNNAIWFSQASSRVLTWNAFWEKSWQCCLSPLLCYWLPASCLASLEKANVCIWMEKCILQRLFSIESASLHYLQCGKESFLQPSKINLCLCV